MNTSLGKIERKAGIKLFITTIPFLAYIFLFSYFPLYGWSYALYDYHAGLKLSQCTYVGLKFFTDLFDDPATVSAVLRVLKNSLGQSFLGLAFSPITPLFAILLMEVKSSKFRRIVQTLTTLPNFISWVLLYAIVWSMLSLEDGFVNSVLVQLHIVDDGINFLQDPSHIWLKMLAYALWKGLGWGAIIYMAAIMGIDQELYEAATVDGAGRIRRIWHITVPGVVPTYFVLLILGLSGIINGGDMGQLYLFQNAMNKPTIETLPLYVFNTGIAGARYSAGIAIGILQSFVAVILLGVSNYLSKLARGETIF